MVKIVEDLAAAPNASIPQAVRDNAALQGLYDFSQNPRVATVFLQPPKSRRKSENLQPLKVQAILAIEENPPIGEKAVCWLLLTTLSVNSLSEASRCLLWYSYRWLIERFHYVLKSGCHLEELQLETADRIQRAIATYGIVAWRLLWLTNGSTSQSRQGS
ncbi:MAG: transposase [Symploca sp. SIO1C2]|nr:transposase [Symploca sp. SIO1C2]